jgi:hypothetical protein
MLAAALLGAACAPKADDASRAPSDSTATPAIADSLRADSVRADSARASGDTGPTVTTSSKALPKADSIIGRDSAFGPRFTIDAQGKQVPIKRP